MVAPLQRAYGCPLQITVAGTAPRSWLADMTSGEAGLPAQPLLPCATGLSFTLNETLTGTCQCSASPMSKVNSQCEAH